MTEQTTQPPAERPVGNPTPPPHWEADVVAADGGTVHLRPIRPEDDEGINGLMARSSDQTRYYRFFGPMKKLSERDLHRFTHVDHVDRVAFVVLLGDQPFLTTERAVRILASPSDPTRPITVPRSDGRPGNPVLLERSAWPLSESLTGDRGMIQAINAHPELVRYVDVPGTNPDIDTTADLAALTSGAGPGRSCRTADEDRSRP